MRNRDRQAIGGGRYRVRSKLGEGGMGFVYKAWDDNLQCDVVVKAPRTEMMGDPEFAGRFTREIRSLVLLAHPQVVRVLDVGRHEQTPFAVMQFLEGGNLRDRGDPAELPVSERSQQLSCWLEGIAAALDFVHGQGYVHRDVKPENTFFDKHGNPYLGDFGVAKVIADARPERLHTIHTGAGLVLGTPHYMAPELILGEAFDGRADQYALAICVFEMISGRYPFVGAAAPAIFVQHTNNQPPRLEDVLPGLPAALGDAVDRALAKDPKKRYGACAAFAGAVMQSIRGFTFEAPSEPAGNRGFSWANLFSGNKRPPDSRQAADDSQAIDVTLAESSESAPVDSPAMPPVSLSSRARARTRQPEDNAAATAPTSQSRTQPNGRQMTQCPACQRGFQLAESAWGKKVRCPACKEVFRAPEKPALPQLQPDLRAEDAPRASATLGWAIVRVLAMVLVGCVSLYLAYFTRMALEEKHIYESSARMREPRTTSSQIPPALPSSSLPPPKEGPKAEPTPLRPIQLPSPPAIRLKVEPEIIRLKAGLPTRIGLTVLVHGSPQPASIDAKSNSPILTVQGVSGTWQVGGPTPFELTAHMESPDTVVPMLVSVRVGSMRLEETVQVSIERTAIRLTGPPASVLVRRKSPASKFALTVDPGGYRGPIKLEWNPAPGLSIVPDVQFLESAPGNPCTAEFAIGVRDDAELTKKNISVRATAATVRSLDASLQVPIDVREKLGELRSKRLPFAVSSAAWSPKDDQLLIGCENGYAYLYDAAILREPKQLCVGETPVTAVSISPSGKHALCGDKAGGVSYWNLFTGGPEKHLTGFMGAIQAVGFENNETAFTWGEGDSRLLRKYTISNNVNLRGNLTVQEQPVSGTRLWLSRTPQFRLKTGEARSLNKEIVAEFQCPNGPDKAFSLSGNCRRFLAAGKGRWLGLWEADPWRRVEEWPLKFDLAAVALSPTGEQAILCDTNRTIYLWQLP